ncbi:MAG: DUF4241 domain-containing protein [Proteobacteria bacterium]|nr:DUF4241 domain-containing protein [Pseudomonadota bacterium]
MAGVRSFLSSVFTLLAGHGASAAVPDYAEAFTRAFDATYRLTVDEGGDGKPPRLHPTSFRVLELGKLKIVSGRIAACDPFVSIDSRAPFSEPVPNGTFLVRLAIAEGGLNDGRVAFARIDFSPAPAVKWQMAVTEGQDASTLAGHEIFGYPVDAGTGAFYDPKSAEALTSILKSNPDAWEEWQAKGEANGQTAHLKPNFFLMLPAGETNVAMFASGWGDGFYASYFGYDKDGRVVALITDFAIIDWEKVKP